MAKKPNHEAPAEAETSGLTLTIQGIHFQATAPYAEGHALTALEANALNHLRGENLRNNFASQVKKAHEAQAKAELEAGYSEDQLSKELHAGTVESLRSVFAQYDSEYTFSLRTPRVATDPVEAEAIKMAKSIVRDALHKNKIDVKSLPEGRMNELATMLLGKQPGIREEAAKRVAATKSLAEATLGMEGLLGAVQ